MAFVVSGRLYSPQPARHAVGEFFAFLREIEEVTPPFVRAHGLDCGTQELGSLPILFILQKLVDTRWRHRPCSPPFRKVEGRIGRAWDEGNPTRPLGRTERSHASIKARQFNRMQSYLWLIFGREG